MIVHVSGDGCERVASADLLTHVLGIPRAQQTSAHAQRLAHAMEHVGWSRNPGGRVTIDGVPVRGYIRSKHKAATVKKVPFEVARQLCDAALGIKEPPPHPIPTGLARMSAPSRSAPRVWDW